MIADFFEFVVMLVIYGWWAFITFLVVVGGLYELHQKLKESRLPKWVHTFERSLNLLVKNAERLLLISGLSEEEIGYALEYKKQRKIREELEAKARQKELAEAREREREEARRKEEAARLKREQDARRKKPAIVRPRKFDDPAVTRLYLMYQDSFPDGGGFTCRGEWVGSELSAKARQVLEPCFVGQPQLKQLSTQIIKLIHADAGDARLTSDERTRIFQLFYEPSIQIRKSATRTEDKICL